jgi:hypothetical protein
MASDTTRTSPTVIPRTMPAGLALVVSDRATIPPQATSIPSLPERPSSPPPASHLVAPQPHRLHRSSRVARVVSVVVVVVPMASAGLAARDLITSILSSARLMASPTTPRTPVSGLSLHLSSARRESSHLSERQLHLSQPPAQAHMKLHISRHHTVLCFEAPFLAVDPLCYL